ncbi:MAG TPA: VIT1/CCC1 transporter family protein [Armatimonadota bacterium]|nr:VIT1/CCC1 transporter family protein [Armatimonadota bacterium]
MPAYFGQPYEAALRRARRERAERLGGIHVEDMVLGANDGIITTFAVVAGATGGSLSTAVILILGFANLFADAVSMGTSNYLGKRSRRDYVEAQREMEEWEVHHTPEDEKQEIRDIFQKKGLENGELDTVVDAITQNRSAWVDVMMSMELGLAESPSSPWKHGMTTAVAFIIAGLVPLIPYLFCSGTVCFGISAVAAAIMLFTTGALRTLITGVNWLRGGLEILGVGSAAALIAYGVGRLIASIA